MTKDTRAPDGAKIGLKVLPVIVVKNEDNLPNYDCVPIHHGDVDSLIARMMQHFELNGDVEQRNALKNVTKATIRQWLNDVYLNKCGYDMFGSNRNELEQAEIKYYYLER